MRRILYFDARAGASLGGVQEALLGLGAVLTDDKPRLGWVLILAEEILRSAGVAVYDRIGMAGCLRAIASLAPEEVFVSHFPLGGEAPIPGAKYGPGDGFSQPEAVAMLTALAQSVELPIFTLERASGGGGGVRALLGTCEEEAETLTLLEANVDDMTAELLAPLPGLLIGAGALDAWLTPILMKKGRPAHMLSALCRGDADGVQRAIFLNSSTLGVRWTRLERAVLERTFELVQTPWGAVSVKVAWLDGKALRGAPEYGDCERLAKEAAVPIREVYEAALTAWRAGER